jgi:hypothetical protein
VLRPGLEQTGLAVARAKGGVITLAELRALGVKKWHVRAWRTAKTLVEILPKVYRAGAIPDTWMFGRTRC